MQREGTGFVCDEQRQTRDREDFCALQIPSRRSWMKTNFPLSWSFCAGFFFLNVINHIIGPLLPRFVLLALDSNELCIAFGSQGLLRNSALCSAAKDVFTLCEFIPLGAWNCDL